MTLNTKEVTANKTKICRETLDALPDWFALEEDKEKYAEEAATLPMLGCFDENTDKCVGFLSLKESSDSAAEIFVMGILPEFHRTGSGTALVHNAEAWARDQGKVFLFVKTLAPEHPDPYYAQTRQFYKKLGFTPLTTLPEVWNKDNPCLIMVKGIGDE